MAKSLKISKSVLALRRGYNAFNYDTMSRLDSYLSRLLTVSKLLNQLPPALSFSTKNIRRQLHRDAELTIAGLHPHHPRVALEGLVFEM